MLILLPLQGVFFVCAHTQGVALGYKILAFSGRRFINFRKLHNFINLLSGPVCA